MKKETPKKKIASKPASKPKTRKKTSVKKEKPVAKGEVKLSNPWSPDSQMQSVWIEGDSTETLDNFVSVRSQLHRTYIQEAEKTKRLGLILAVFLLALGLLIILYAPEGRETFSYWIGGALLIFAAGAAGYKRVWGKTKILSIGADQDQSSLQDQATLEEQKAKAPADIRKPAKKYVKKSRKGEEYPTLRMLMEYKQKQSEPKDEDA